MGMNYELAKQLKDAGFPQHLDPTWVEDEGVVSSLGYSLLPTLSELIEACKEDFVTLRKTSNGWEATGHKVVEDKERTIAAYSCETPEEAVAKLWLFFNEKV